MQVTQKKINSQNPAKLRKEILARASKIEKYLGAPRVNEKVFQATFIPTNPKKSSGQLIANKTLLNAQTTLTEIKSAMLNEFDAGKLKGLIAQLTSLEKAVNSAAPRREFNHKKLL